MAQKFLTYSEVDTAIQNKMSNRVPAESRRLEAINDLLQGIFAQYDISTSLRRVSISVIPNGTAYDVSGLVTDDDVKKIRTIKYDDGDDNYQEFIQVPREDLEEHIDNKVYINEYCIYFQDGVQYLKLNSVENLTTAQTVDMDYFTYFVAYETVGATFEELLLSNSTYVILLPKRFKNVIVWGAVKELLYPAIGEDAERRYAIVSNKFKSELAKIGLDYTGTKAKSKHKQIKLRPQY